MRSLHVGNNGSNRIAAGCHQLFGPDLLSILRAIPVRLTTSEVNPDVENVKTFAPVHLPNQLRKDWLLERAGPT
jgi:hypothetical protein